MYHCELSIAVLCIRDQLRPRFCIINIFVDFMLSLFVNIK
ncbi:hypothetical protein TSMEX_001116 [Taenia solium]|eukprot:TsM_000360500 transcript=TsM_000360500 gene=TsM_000360500